MLLLLPISAPADPTVVIEPEAAGVPTEVVAQIISDSPDAGAITIIRHHTASEIPQAAVQADESSAAAPVVVMLITLAAWGLIRPHRKLRIA